ncbi:phytanoyl-CoA dioxygenase family protein [Blastococcus sp. SYSU D00695]
MTTTTTRGLRRLPATAPLEDLLQVYREDGGVILQGFLSPEQVRAVNAELDPHLEGVKAGNPAHDTEAAADFHGRQTKRMNRLVVRSRTFREEVLDLDLLHDLCRAVFEEESGSYWMTTAQLIQIGPGNAPQTLHRDLEDHPPFVGMGQAGPEVMVNFMIALTEFTDANGGTRVIPGSNTWPDYTDRGTQEMTVPVEMEAGDAFFFSGKVVHGGGANRTADEHRRGIALPLQPSYLTPEEPYLFIVDLDLVRTLPTRVQSILGFRSQQTKGSPAGVWFVDSGRELADHLGL